MTPTVFVICGDFGATCAQVTELSTVRTDSAYSNEIADKMAQVPARKGEAGRLEG